jgi:hypothetical protein
MRYFKIWTIFFALLLVLPAFAQTPVNITFGWDKSSDDTRNPLDTHPITYKLYVSTTAPTGGTMPANSLVYEAGSNLEKLVPLTAGTYWAAVSAQWCAVFADNACSGTALIESGLSNVLRVQVQVPPGNPSNYRVRITGLP